MVKLLLPSPEGKECLLGVRAQGDIFGELCLSGQISRLETAVAMQDVGLKQMSYRSFLMSLKQESCWKALSSIWQCGSPNSRKSSRACNRKQRAAAGKNTVVPGAEHAGLMPAAHASG